MGNTHSFQSDDVEDYSDSELSYWNQVYRLEERRWQAKLATLSGSRWDPPNFWGQKLAHAQLQLQLISTEQGKRQVLNIEA